MDDWDAPATPEQVEAMRRSIIARVRAERTRARWRIAALAPTMMALTVAVAALATWTVTDAIRPVSDPPGPVMIALDCYADASPNGLIGSARMPEEPVESMAERAAVACVDAVAEGTQRAARRDFSDPTLCAVGPGRVAVIPDRSGQWTDGHCTDLGLEPFRGFGSR
jgi:hypothetical protein